MSSLKGIRRLKRSLPFLGLLKQATTNLQRKQLLMKFPVYVIDDIVEILYNILYKNVSVRNLQHKAFLLRKKRILSEIVQASKYQAKRRKLIQQQNGGFIASLLPVLMSVLGGVIGSAV